MGKYVIDETTLTGIGDAIREKEGTTEAIPVSNMKARIQAIDTQEDLGAEMATQEELIRQIMTELEGKCTLTETCSVTITVEDKTKVCCTVVENGTSFQEILIVAREDNPRTISNVQCGTPLFACVDYYLGSEYSGCELVSEVNAVGATFMMPEKSGAVSIYTMNN